MGNSSMLAWLLTLRRPCLQTQCQAGGSSTISTPPRKAAPSAPKVRRSVSSRVHEAGWKLLSPCVGANVTPVYEARGAAGETRPARRTRLLGDDNRTYQASSPDEVSHRKCASEAGPQGAGQRLPWLLRLPTGVLAPPRGVREGLSVVFRMAFATGQCPPGLTPALSPSLWAGAFIPEPLDWVQGGGSRDLLPADTVRSLHASSCDLSPRHH